jgi:N-acetylglucosamine-6-phosphate deacetylase
VRLAGWRNRPERAIAAATLLPRRVLGDGRSLAQLLLGRRLDETLRWRQSQAGLQWRQADRAAMGC